MLKKKEREREKKKMSGLINTILITRENSSFDYRDLHATIKSCLSLRSEIKIIVIIDTFRTDRPSYIREIITSAHSKGITCVDVKFTNNGESYDILLPPNQKNSDLRNGIFDIREMGSHLQLKAGQILEQKAFNAFMLKAYRDGVVSMQDSLFTKPTRTYGTLLSPPPGLWYKKRSFDLKKNVLTDAFKFICGIFDFCCFLFFHFWFVYANAFKWLAFASTCFCGRFSDDLNVIKVFPPLRDGNFSKRPIYTGFVRDAVSTLRKSELVGIGIKDVGVLRSIWITLISSMTIFQATNSPFVVYGISVNLLLYVVGGLFFLLVQYRTIRWIYKPHLVLLYLALCWGYSILFPLFLGCLWIGKIAHFFAKVDECRNSNEL